jgi:AraC-like DNA-binding protein
MTAVAPPPGIDEGPHAWAGRVCELTPAPVLRGFVRCYHYTELRLGAARVSKPLTARPEQMMQFSLAQPFSVRDHALGTRWDAPDVVLVGRQTRRNVDLISTGELRTFTVHFEPTGFHRLFHEPMAHLTDVTPAAEDVLGPEVLIVREALCESATPYAMAAHVEAMLERRLQAARPFHPIQRVANAIAAHPEVVDVRAMADASYLSVRQFERVFLEQVGVAPKLFGQIARFVQALEAKSRDPQRTWADVAVDAGYYDQMHLVRESHRFGGASPSVLIESWIDCAPDEVLAPVASVLAG